MKRPALAIASILTTFSCSQSKRNELKDAVQVPEVESIPAITCPRGKDASSFVFMPLDEMPDRGGLGLPAGGDAAVIAEPGRGDNLRLDVCVKDDIVKVRRLVSISNGVQEISTIPAGARINGLSKVIFERDYSDLDIDVPLESLQMIGDASPSPTEEHLRIVGHQLDTVGYAVAYWVDSSRSGSSMVTSRAGTRVLVGGLEFGDFDATACPGGFAANGEFTLGTAHFEWQGCQYMGTSGGVAPQILSFTITDNAPQLPVPLRGTPFRAQAEGNSDYLFRNNHHSVCDSFALTVPHATYGVTASSGMNGGAPGVDLPDPVVQNAPACRTVTRYRFRYGTSTTWVTGDAPASCTHFSRYCP